LPDESAGEMRPRGSRVTAKHVLLALIVLGFAFRVTSLVNRDLGFDANYYLTMGQSLLKHGEFYMPWGDPSNLNGVPQFSHHISPLFPAWLSMFYALFGSSYAITQLASFIISLLGLVAVYRATKDLYGSASALVATAIFILDFELIVETGKIYSENMTFLFFTLTMWAIIRGVKDDRYIVFAGLFAGLAYSVRSSLGYFFIVAGVAGFLWRFYYMRWAVFRNKWYMLAIAVFLCFVGGWSLRNLYHFGWPNWETSAAIQSTLLGAFSQPVQYLTLVVLLVPFFVLILLMYGAYMLPELKSSVRHVRDEQVSGLWLAVFLVPFIALFVSGALSLSETQRGVPLFWRDRVRYIFYAFLPLVWLGVRGVDFRLDRSLGEILRGVRFPLAAIKARIGEILHNRLWLVGIGAILLGAVVSLFTMGGWLAAFLFMAVPALFFRSPRKRFAVFLAVLLVFSTEAGTAEVKFAAPKVGADINSMLAPGEVVAVDGVNYHQFYFLYPFVTDAENRIVSHQDYPDAPYLVSYNVSRTYAGYNWNASYYDESQGGWISQAWAMLWGQTTHVSTLTIRLWKHI
jgi:hypothetical protein